MLGLPRYKDIFGNFTVISLYREFRYNDSSIKRYNLSAPLVYRYTVEPRYNEDPAVTKTSESPAELQ